ncbi:MAG: DUF523 domain-containing protein [Spirochaetia bacterium]|nr:DUF523 domain-containing protein [Spirochaetia bacterium]
MILVSACLAGIPCRYDGGSFLYAPLLQLIQKGAAVPVCPETACGLPTPRACIELHSESRHAFDSAGNDFTLLIQEGINEVLSRFDTKLITAVVLKDKSPTCGSLHIYDGSFSGRTIPGIGLFAERLHSLGIPLFTESSFLIENSFQFISPFSFL